MNNDNWADGIEQDYDSRDDSRDETVQEGWSDGIEERNISLEKKVTKEEHTSWEDCLECLDLEQSAKWYHCDGKNMSDNNNSIIPYGNNTSDNNNSIIDPYGNNMSANNNSKSKTAIQEATQTTQATTQAATQTTRVAPFEAKFEKDLLQKPEMVEIYGLKMHKVICDMLPKKLEKLMDIIALKQVIKVSFWFMDKKYGYQIVAFANGLFATPIGDHRYGLYFVIEHAWLEFNCMKRTDQMRCLEILVDDILTRMFHIKSSPAINLCKTEVRMFSPSSCELFS
jgi:hypothetical protein